MSENPYEKVSILDRSFWDLWLQKLLRNVASVKYQFMVAFFWIVTTGMFKLDALGKPLISFEVGLAFLGGGFISLVTSRIIMSTSLTTPKEDGMDTDK